MYAIFVHFYSLGITYFLKITSAYYIQKSMVHFISIITHLVYIILYFRY